MALRRFSRSLDPADKVDDIARAFGERHFALFQAILEAEETGAWAHDGLDFFDQWVSQRCDVTVYKARRWIASARALRGLPLIADALRTGYLGVDKVVELTRFATPDKQERQIEWARRSRVADVKARADEANAAPKDDVEMAERGRYLGRRFSMDGLQMSIYGHMPAIDGELVWAALEEIADSLQPLPEDEPFDEIEERGLRMADALVIAVAASSAQEEGFSPSLTVHAELEALQDGSKSGRIEDGPTLHPAIVEMLACDARLRVVIENEGKPVGVSSEAYSPPRWMRRQLKHRDRGCVFPGCTCRSFMQPHHVTPHPNGPTALDSLVWLCWRHHKLVHVFGWRVTIGRGPQDFPSIEWFRPDGSRFGPGPAPP